MSEEKFSAIAKILTENRVKYEKQIKEFCVTTEVCPFQDFLRGYEDEAKAIDAQQTSSDDTLVACSISSFRETFQQFEKYPPNLQKPKKQVSKDFNTTMLRAVNRSQSASDLALEKLAAAEQWEEGPNATDIYKNYRKFMKMLKQLQELPKDGLELNYVQILQKIHTLAKNIEKLQDDTFQDTEIAFTKEDTEILRQFTENFEKALYVEENPNLFKDFTQNEQSLQNVSNVIDLLDYCFEKIGHYREKK